MDALSKYDITLLGSTMPQNFFINSTGNRTIKFSFDHPSFHIGYIIQYEVQCNRGYAGYPTFAHTTQNDTETSVVSLLPNEKYKCKV